MWVDGVYVKAGLEREKAGDPGGDGGPERRKEGGGERDSGYRESIESWSDVLRDMRRRGLECPRL